MDFNLLQVAAEAATTTSTDTEAMSCGSASGGLSLILMYAAILLICYLLLIKPQKKRKQQEDELRKSVQIGDEITTIGGICGRIVSIKEDETIVIETGADRTKIKMKNWAISTNETAKSRSDAAAPAQKEGFFSKLFGKKERTDVNK